MLHVSLGTTFPALRGGTDVIPDQWPWSWEEEAEWQEELRQEEFGWMDELIDHMINDGLAGSSYDPLQPQEDWADERTVAP